MKRRKAVFTITQNETWLLKFWLDYYLLNFDAADIYVLEHRSNNDTGTQHVYPARVNPVFVYNDISFDHTWLKHVVSAFQNFLLASYEYVLFAETDELIVPDPEKFPSLAAYIDQLKEPHVRCTGYEIQHDPEQEAAIKLSRPILEQRKFWHVNHDYSKVLLANHGLDWCRGFHYAFNALNLEPSNELFLIHYKKVDFDLLLMKNANAMRRKWSDFDLKNGQGIQHTLTNVDTLRGWFDKTKNILEPIPHKFKEVKGL